ncbi:hypothetical protein BDN71DRAFT_1513309 [Pleurotus eryngii]|uniref:DUF6589 domain-containing protein n=1 Tax=Pleurotus eryngii TaxID=5323 RepID=A0A9P5ZIL4_PLEER|nr:hypothetical protein BDN71DRAFT_1513309 [Pleurotus eryngii]
MNAPPYDNANQHGNYFDQHSAQLGFHPVLAVPASEGPIPFQIWNQASHSHHGHPTPLLPAQYQFAHPATMPPAFYTPSLSRKRPAFTWDENEPPVSSPLANDSRKRQNTDSHMIDTASTPHAIHGSSTSDALSPLSLIAPSHALQVKSRPLASMVLAIFLPLSSTNGLGRRPADIVQAIYEHPYSHVGRKEEPFHDAIMPDYAYPLDLDVPETELAQPGTPAQATLNFWVAKMALKLVNGEAEALATEKSFRLPANWTWDAVTSLSLGDIQKRMVQLAPLTWSIIATVAVSPHRRLRSKNTCSSTAEEIDAKKSDLEHASHSPWKAIAFNILILLSIRNNLIALGPTIIGLLFFIADASRLVYHALGRFGITTSYSTVLDHLGNLGHSAGLHLCEVGSCIACNDDHYIILFDNINKHHRAWHQTVSKDDEVKSGTAATIIRMVYVPNGAMNLKKYRNRQQRKGCKGLTVRKLLNDLDHTHLKNVGAATLLQIWTDKVSSLAFHHDYVRNLFENNMQKHRIPLHKSETLPLHTSGIDESTTAGNSDVLHDITHLQMGMTDEDFGEFVIPVAGDQLTVDRVQKLIHYTKKDVNDYSRHTWALPCIQLWHMKWVFLKAIYKAHWSPSTGKYLFGLHRDCNTLGRTKLNPTKCDFYPHHHAVVETFEISCLGILRVLLKAKCSKADLTASQQYPLLHALDEFFKPGSRFASKPIGFLEHLAKTAYRRYLCTAAYDDSLGASSRNKDIYGEEPLESSHKPADNTWNGDRALANLVLQLRDFFWYYEMCHAISDGDIGRVFEVIKILRFYFWGSGSTNYGNELLELACNFLYDFPEDLQVALLNNWLVNPSGKLGHWHELDLLQEHNNLIIKTMYNDCNLDFDSDFIQKTVSLNIGGFSQFRSFMSSFFDITVLSGEHTDPNMDADINTLAAHHRRNNVLNFEPGREQSRMSPDFFAVGINKLASGQLDVFKERTLRDGNSVQPDKD